MICPHCKKLIVRGLPSSSVKEVQKLSAKGYSLRDISKILEKKKIHVSPATLSRYLKGKNVRP